MERARQLVTAHVRRAVHLSLARGGIGPVLTNTGGSRANARPVRTALRRHRTRARVVEGAPARSHVGRTGNHQVKVGEPLLLVVETADQDSPDDLGPAGYQPCL
jgi:hypothetical protein